MQTHSSMRIRLGNIARAAQLIDPVFLNTPQFVCEPLAAELGMQLVIKVETLNPIRAFKGRGADFYVHQLEDSTPLVAASAGNFGQALAWSCRARGTPLTVFAAEDANALKVSRMRELGATVRLEGGDFEVAKSRARVFAADRHLLFVEDGRDAAITEGAGTIGIELLRWSEPLHAILVPLGDGALVSGIGTWIKAHAPATRVLAVAAAGAPAMHLSWRAGKVVETERTDTIADGVATRVPVAEALADMRWAVDDVVLVDDATILRAMRLVWKTLGLMLEPAGAVGVAAALAHGEQLRGQTVGTVLSGGNVTAEDAARWFGNADDAEVQPR